MRRLLLVAVVAVCFAGSSLAHACSCIRPPAPKVALAGAAEVFAGKVIDVTLVKGQHRVTFAVSKTWKGAGEKQVVLTTSIGGGSCGYSFTKGTEYLVYAYTWKKEGEANPVLETNICTRTKMLSAAAEDLKELGEGKTPAEKK